MQGNTQQEKFLSNPTRFTVVFENGRRREFTVASYTAYLKKRSARLRLVPFEELGRLVAEVAAETEVRS